MRRSRSFTQSFAGELLPDERVGDLFAGSDMPISMIAIRDQNYASFIGFRMFDLVTIRG